MRAHVWYSHRWRDAVQTLLLPEHTTVNKILSSLWLYWSTELEETCNKSWSDKRRNGKALSFYHMDFFMSECQAWHPCHFIHFPNAQWCLKAFVPGLEHLRSDGCNSLWSPEKGLKFPNVRSCLAARATSPFVYRQSLCISPPMWFMSQSL